MKVRVKNLTNTNGKAVPNQFEIEIGDKLYFQSYDSIIAVYNRREGKTTLDKNLWDYSNTTGKYRNRWLGDGSKARTEQRIKEGFYRLADLNQ